MGRTNPTFRDYLDRVERRYAPFRRGLRRRYKPDLDRLFDRARDHADAAGYHNGTDPDTTVLVAVLLAHEHELRRLRERLAEAGAPSDGDGAGEGESDGGGGGG